MALQIRRGTEAERQSMSAGDPAVGEILYITDTDLVYVGDGVIAGGHLVGCGISVIEAVALTGGSNADSIHVHTSNGVTDFELAVESHNDVLANTQDRHPASHGIDSHTDKAIRLAKTSSAVDDIGGWPGVTRDITWDVQTSVDVVFSHSTTVDNHQITVAESGWYYIKSTVTGLQGGTARTTFMLYPTINGAGIFSGTARNYSRGSYYGDAGNTLVTEVYLAAGDVVTIRSQVDHTDTLYVTNTIYDQCELIIRKIG